MELVTVMSLAGYVIYTCIGLLAAWGAFCVILLTRQIARRLFRNADASGEYTSQVGQLLRDGSYEDAEKLSSTPENWYRAVPVLVRGIIAKRHLGLEKIRQTIATTFEREILAELENRLAWVNTVIKSAPLLGLLGTVVGMIGAFAQIKAERPDPSALAGNISVALFTTALGLVVAIPLLLAANFVQARLRSLEDSAVEQMQLVLDDMEFSADA